MCARAVGPGILRGAGPRRRVATSLVVFVLGLAPASALAQTTVRVAAYNIRHGRGMDGEVDLARVASVLRAIDADVIALQEVDDRTGRTGGVDQVAVLAWLLGYAGPHGPHRPYQGGHYGNAILTRLPVVAWRTHPIPPASGSGLAVHEVELELAGSTPRGDARVGSADPPMRVSVVSVHLAGTPGERSAQADSLTRFFSEAPRPVILAGDFNGRPDDVAMARLAGRWRVLAKSGPPETYPADVPDREIDFVLVRPEDGLELLEHRVVDEPLASDHRPLVAELLLLPFRARRP